GGISMSEVTLVAVVVLVFLLDFVADFAGNLGPDESVEQIDGKNNGQNDGQNQTAQDDQEADEKDGNDGLGETAPGPQVERFERRIFDFANHHDGEKDEQSRQNKTPRPGGEVAVGLIAPHQK